MKIIDFHTNATAVAENTVVALGFFDGVHAGHRHLLKTAIEEAKKRGLASLVLTFSEEGSAGLKSDSKRIFSEKTRLDVFEELGVEYAVLLKYEKVKEMSHTEFVRDVIVGFCRAELAVCGFNFRYGEGALGNAQTLYAQMSEFGFDCIVEEPYLYEGAPISSSRIRECVANGDIKRASDMLGECFSVTSEILHGKALGRVLGIPTANQSFPPNMALPRFGVYATRVRIDGKMYNAVTNIGMRPTVDDGEFVNCESHIIDYDGDLYGKVIRIDFYEMIREEKKFSSLDELRTQIEKDRKEAEQWLITFGQN